MPTLDKIERVHIKDQATVEQEAQRFMDLHAAERESQLEELERMTDEAEKQIEQRLAAHRAQT